MFYYYDLLETIDPTSTKQNSIQHWKTIKDNTCDILIDVAGYAREDLKVEKTTKGIRLTASKKEIAGVEFEDIDLLVDLDEEYLNATHTVEYKDGLLHIKSVLAEPKTEVIEIK